MRRLGFFEGTLLLSFRGMFGAPWTMIRKEKIPDEHGGNVAQGALKACCNALTRSDLTAVPHEKLGAMALTTKCLSGRGGI